MLLERNNFIRKGDNIMADEKVMKKEGYELDMDVEPTEEEIAAAEKMAEEWEGEQDG